MNRVEWSNASTVEEVLAQLGPKAIAKAGGIDVSDLMKEGIASPGRLVNIRRVKGLDVLEETKDGGLRVGPLLTLARLASDPVVQRKARALADACGHAATPQIRNAATLGGNLLQRPRCWYFRSEEFHCKRKGGEHCFAMSGENAYHAIFDNDRCAIVHPSASAVALVALGASLQIKDAAGTRDVPLETFFVTPDKDILHENTLKDTELVTEIRIPARAAKSSSAYTKLGEKESYDWPLAEVAVVLDFDGSDKCTRASIVLGAAAPVPHRATAAQTALVGKSIDEETARAAAKAAISGATPLHQNAYKLALFETIVRRTILDAKAALGKSQ